MSTGRLLIVAGATAASADELPESVRELIAEASEVLVVAPVLTSKLHLWTNDTDRAREQADERLTAVLGEVEAIGISWARAAQTGYYHAWDPPPRVEPRFVREEVDALVGLAREHDAAWGRWFSDRVIEPLELRFDDVVADPSAASTRVLAHLGLPDQPTVVRTDPSPPSDWQSRYRR